MNKLTIADLNEFVAYRKGVCLSNEYTDTKATYKWRCIKGHTFDMTLTSVRQGAWCTMCRKGGNMEEYMELCKAHAKEKNGEFLTKSLKNKKSKSTWRCERGHEWTVCTYDVLTKKSWCMACPSPRVNTLKLAHDIAKARGGKCLSTIVEDSNGIVSVECSKGHQWDVKINELKRGGWCRICFNNSKGIVGRIFYPELIELLKQHKLKTISPESKFTNQRQILTFVCEKGHKWKDTTRDMIRFKWKCPQCTNRIKPQKHSLKEMKSLAATHGGMCLSKEYDYKHMMEWKCNKNHLFKMKATAVLRGKWCQKCSGRFPYGIEEMQKLAKSHKGKCLSTEYVSTYQKMEWQCEKGHVWFTSAKSVIQGGWCKSCCKTRPFTLDYLKTFALRNGGECLNKEYKAKLTPIIFKCKQGHVWKAHPSSVGRNHWCRICNTPRYSDDEIKSLFKPGIEDMKILAKEMNGKCKSGYFINMDSPLQWICKKGHEWKASYNSVRKGSWCPKCCEVKVSESYNAELLSVIRFKQGKLLSLKIGRNVKIQCKNGHTFVGVKSRIRTGKWCLSCNNESN